MDFEKVKRNFLTLYVRVKKNKFITLLLTLLAGLFVLLGYLNTFSDFKNNYLLDNHSHVPAFKNSSLNDSINILVARFKDNYNPNKSSYMGNAIYQRVNVIIRDKQLPINIKYIDTLIVDAGLTQEEVRLIAKNNNSDLLIYGNYRSQPAQLESEKVNFKVVSNDFLKAIADSNYVSLDNEGDKFFNIKPYQLEDGEFSLDTISFDNWIQSLYVLKQRATNYRDYVTLYKIDTFNLGIPERIIKYRSRALLNKAIGNLYDAAIDYDSAYNLAIRFSNNYVKDLKINALDERAILIELYIESLDDHINNILLNKLLCYANFRDYKRALRIINDEIVRLEKGNVEKLEIDTSRSSSRESGAVKKREELKKLDVEISNGNVKVKNPVKLSNTYRFNGYFSNKFIPDYYLLKSYILFNKERNLLEAEKAFLKAKGANSNDAYYTAAINIYEAKDSLEAVDLYYNEAIKKGLSLIPIISHMANSKATMANYKKRRNKVVRLSIIFLITIVLSSVAWHNVEE